MKRLHKDLFMATRSSSPASPAPTAGATGATNLIRLCAFLVTLLALITFDVLLVPSKNVWVPKQQRDFQRQQQERKQRVVTQNALKHQMEADVELAMFELEAVLKGARLDPTSREVQDRLEKLRSKFGGGQQAVQASSSLQTDQAETDDSEDNEEADGGEEEPVFEKKPVVLAISSEIFPIVVAENADAEEWSKLRPDEVESALAELVESWIAQGKTKRLGIDLLDDPLYALPSARSPLLRSSGKKIVEAKVEIPKAEPGDAQRRFVSRPKPVAPGPMVTFCANLRESRTYSHMIKAVDTERRLKELGYKQSTGHKAKVCSCLVLVTNPFVS